MLNEKKLKEVTREGEHWKPVVGFEGLYMVSDLGRVYSLQREIILKQSDQHGKCMISRFVKLTKDHKRYNKKVHRLVAEAFVPNPENKPQVNHKNENHQDNRACNLEWMTNQENSAYSFGVHVLIVPLDGSEEIISNSMRAASKIIGVTDGTIKRHIENGTPIHNKYIVKKIDKTVHV